MARELTLNCIVFEGQPDYKRSFSIKILDTANVEALREAIKVKKSNTFHNIDADALEIWKVSFPRIDTSEALLRECLSTSESLDSLEKLGSLFPDTPREDHLHIIVQLPHITAPPVPQSLLVLNCLVLGDQQKHIFPVEIAPTKSVGSLRKVIKEEKARLFGHVDADDLVLWKVSEVVGENLESNLEKANFSEQKPLLPVDELLNVFSELPIKGRLHIVIGRPAGELNEERDELTELRVKNISKRPRRAPSTGATPTMFLKEQTNNPIAMGRPKNGDSYPIPISLFHAEFALFKEDLVYGPLDQALSPLAHRWVMELASFFDSEGKRESKFHELLSELFGHRVYKQKIGSFITDGGVDIAGLGVKPVAVEIKNETTVGGSDALWEIVLYDLEGVRLILEDERYKGDWRKTRIPSLLIVHNGPNVQALGAVYLSKQYVEVLSPSLPLYFNEYDTRLMENLLRFMTALRRLFCSLCRVYEKPNDYAVETSQVDFPYPRSYPSSPGSSVQFTYIERISTIRLVFTARTVDDKIIIVKFGTGHYGAEAHQAAAKAGLAPALLSHSELTGGWWMVVMEPLQSGFKACDEFNTLDQQCQEVITESLHRFHALGFVHGDLRDSNVFVRWYQGQCECQIIDYDWAGKQGDVVYPIGVYNNDFVWRPKRYMDRDKITSEHDADTVKEFLRRRTSS